MPTESVRIPIVDLRIGMHVLQCDRAWWHTPFWRRRFRITRQDDITALQRAGIRHVIVQMDVAAAARSMPPVADSHASAPSASPSRPSMGQALIESRQQRDEMLGRMDSIFEGAAAGHGLSATALTDVRGTMLRYAESNPAASLYLTLQQDHHRSLGTHALAVASIAALMARRLSRTGPELEDLTTAALTHDIGLVKLPARLLGSHPLTRLDIPLFDSHPQLAGDLLGPDIPAAARALVLDHHGIPKGTKPEPHANDNLTLMRLADRFDELRTGWLGAKAVSADRALAAVYQEAEDGHYDLRLASALVQMVGVFPLYSTVVLNTGERAIVTRLNAGQLHRPRVAVIVDGAGRRLTKPVLIDLAAPGETRTIASLTTLHADTLKIEEFLMDVPLDL